MTCEPIRVGDDVGIVCHRGPRRVRCYHCGAASDRVCDGKLPRVRHPRKSGSKLCNRPLCADCALHVDGHDVDFCRSHLTDGRAIAAQGSLF